MKGRFHRPHLTGDQTKSGIYIIPRDVITSRSASNRLVIFDDNYIALMPGECRTLRVQIENADTRGEKSRLILERFNVKNPGQVIVSCSE